MNDFWLWLQDSLGTTRLWNRLLEWIPNLFIALIILLLFWALWRGAERAADAAIRRARLDPTAGEFIQTVLKYVLLTIGAVTALGKIGVNTGSILTSLGVAGLTIGFAAKDALSNMISGLFIFWDRPFVIGDLVEVGGQYGRVESITMRSTRVVTPDGRMLAVPNSTVINTTVASYTNFPHLRLDIPFTVAVTENLARVRSIALNLCLDDLELMRDPPAVVVVTALNDYNIAMQLQVWLDDEKKHVAARQALREKLFEALRAGGVDMPFETFSLAPVEIRGACRVNGGA
ncbi:MAG: mechanosensitive ion channel family protein [Betaproteobacteria bacterium]